MWRFGRGFFIKSLSFIFVDINIFLLASFHKKWFFGESLLISILRWDKGGENYGLTVSYGPWQLLLVNTKNKKVKRGYNNFFCGTFYEHIFVSRR